MRWQNRFVSDAESSGRSIRLVRATTPASAAEHANNRKSGTAFPGTEDSLRTWLHRWTKMEIKSYLVSGLAGITIASMARTLSEGSPKLKSKPTEA